MTSSDAVHDVDIAIIGAGFGGVAMGIEIERRRLGSYVIFERSSDLGGTWRDNTYPGVACDVPAPLYRYSFAPHVWTRRYPPQSEILEYLRTCANRFGVTPHIRLNYEVTEAVFDETAFRWIVTGPDGSWRCRFLVSATGQLSIPSVPRIEGASDFAGPAFHSAKWRHDVDLSGRRVGIIGTGASAIQIVPEIAHVASKVTIFQRSAPYVFEKKDRRYSVPYRWLLRVVPWAQLPGRLRYFAYGELLARAILGNQKAHDDIVARWQTYRDIIIPESPLRDATTPSDALGCKRILFSSDWYPALRRENVTLSTSPMVTCTHDAVVTDDGVSHELDVLIYATGFATQSFTGHIDVRGRNGATLAHRWSRRPVAHRGVSVPGFPNLYILYGPNTNLGSNSIIYMLEAQAAYSAALMRATLDERVGALEVTESACASFVAWVDEQSSKSTWMTGCRSWYTLDGVNTNNWPASTRSYHRLMRHIDLENYERLGRLSPGDPPERVRSSTAST